MSIQKFDTLENGKLFYISKDIVEDNVYEGTYMCTLRDRSKIKYKTYEVKVKSDSGDEVEVCNKDCYRTYDEAIRARQEHNAELIELRQERIDSLERQIKHINKDITDLESLFRFMLNNMYDTTERLAAIEKIKELYSYDLIDVEAMEVDIW